MRRGCPRTPPAAKRFFQRVPAASSRRLTETAVLSVFDLFTRSAAAGSRRHAQRGREAGLDTLALQCKVIAMQPNWAEENLQVIRTLMERAGLYRRALAPVMLSVGILGLAGWYFGNSLRLDAFREFVAFWFGVAAVAIAVSLLIIRRQALRSAEPFWTAPTKRVIQAMLPALTAGFLMVVSSCLAGLDTSSSTGFVVGWPMLYGCALHSAGQFISRGVRLLGWGFILAAIVIGHMHLHSPMGYGPDGRLSFWLQPHAMMGLTFGGLHLLAGIYLYFTEKREQMP